MPILRESKTRSTQCTQGSGVQCCRHRYDLSHGLHHGENIAGGTIANARVPVGKARVDRRENHAGGGMPRKSATMTHRACDCDDADIDVSYRMCRISVNNSPPFKASTLFDTGAHASFVNREVAAWIGKQAGRATQLGERNEDGMTTRIPRCH